jgi:hypothetical protein
VVPGHGLELRPWRGDRAGRRGGGAGGFSGGGVEGALGESGTALEPEAAGIRGGGGGACGDEAGASLAGAEQPGLPPLSDGRGEAGIQQHQFFMTSKAISRESKRIFDGILSPDWACRSQEDQEDYGVDGEIEITTQEDKATGFIFKFQLKGVERARFDDDGRLIYASASVPRFIYYTELLSTPIVFVVCDVQSRSCYWTKVQGNRVVEQALTDARSRSQSTFTIKLPPRNQWKRDEESLAHLIEAIHASNDSITVRRMRAVSEVAVRAEIPNVEAAVDLEARFRLLAGIALDAKIKVLLESGDFKAALDEAERVFENSSELPSVRISAGFSIIQAMNGITAVDPVPTRRLRMAGFRLGVAGGILRIARLKNCEQYHRIHAIGFARASRLNIAAESVKAAVISELTQKELGDTSSLVFVEVQRLNASSRVARDFLALQRIVMRAVNRSDETLFAVPYIWSTWAEGIVPFLWSLRRSGKEDLANEYLLEMDRLFVGCVAIISFLKDESEVFEILRAIGLRFVTLVVPFSVDETQRRLQDLRDAFGGRMQLPPFSRAFADVETTMSALNASSDAAPSWTIEDAKEHFEQLAYGLGMDVEDPNDQYAEGVRIGIADLDPTRVVSQCKFIHVMTTSCGVPARMLGLPTAGFKKIVCLKHGHSLEALKLDDVYEHFSKRFPWDQGEVRCEDCQDKSPHPEAWSWSEEWQKAQAQKFGESKPKRKPSEE